MSLFYCEEIYQLCIKEKGSFFCWLEFVGSKMHQPERNSNEVRYPGSQSWMSSKCHEDFYLPLSKYVYYYSLDHTFQPEVNRTLPSNVHKAKLPTDVSRIYNLAASGHDVLVGS